MGYISEFYRIMIFFSSPHLRNYDVAAETNLKFLSSVD